MKRERTEEGAEEAKEIKERLRRTASGGASETG